MCCGCAMSDRDSNDRTVDTGQNLHLRPILHLLCFFIAQSYVISVPTWHTLGISRAIFWLPEQSPLSEKQIKTDQHSSIASCCHSVDIGIRELKKASWRKIPSFFLSFLLSGFLDSIILSVGITQFKIELFQSGFSLLSLTAYTADIVRF